MKIYEGRPVVAIVGMCGSGKSVLTGLFSKAGFKYIHFGSVTMKELKKRGLDKNEKNERAIREELRKTYGPAAFAVCLLDEIKLSAEKSPTVLDGVYSWSEYKLLKEKLGEQLFVLAIMTNSKVRYSRLKTRTERPLTEEEAVTRDHSEIENIEKGGPIAIADYYILNNGTLDDMKKAFEDFTAWLGGACDRPLIKGGIG